MQVEQKKNELNLEKSDNSRLAHNNFFTDDYWIIPKKKKKNYDLY